MTVNVEYLGGTETRFHLTADVHTPWSDALAALRTPFTATFDSQPLVIANAAAPAAATPSAVASPTSEPTTEVTAPGEPATPMSLDWVLWGGIGAAIVLLIAVLVLRRPKLAGSLTVQRDGKSVQEIMLTGSSVALTSADEDGPRGTVLAMTGKTPRVQVKAQQGGEKVKAKLADGERVSVGGYDLIYTAKHSRVLEMINV